MMSATAIMALLRGLHLAAMLSLLGTAGFIVWMLPAAIRMAASPLAASPVAAVSMAASQVAASPMAASQVAASQVPVELRRRLWRLASASGLVALLAGAAWFLLQAAAIAGAATLADVVSALPLVAGHTRFGTVLMLRLGLLLAATLLALAATGAWLSGARILIVGYLTLGLVGMALGLQSMIGHAGAMAGAAGDGIIVSEALHLLAAGVWLGALLPLSSALRALAPAQAAAVCERFSPIGLACVLVLAGTGLAQGLSLIGGVPALFGTRYGHIALLKIGLFVVALVLATLNRLWLTDRLAVSTHRAKRWLILSVSVETCIGLAIVAAAAFMASSMPAVHDTPVWPFSWQLSLVTVREDADMLRDVVVSLVVIGGATGLLVTAMLLRRLRLAAFVLLALAVALRGPALGVLTTEAYPTSFETSPTGFSAASIVQGQALFGPNCSVCHGPDGEGDGPAAAGSRTKPANLTLPHIWDHSDGEMFWWLSHGIDDPEGGLAMPGFAGTVPVDGLWALIDYVRAHAAGAAMRQEGAFDVPIQAPAFPLACTDLSASSMADLRGDVVRVVAGEVAQHQIVLDEVPRDQLVAGDVAQHQRVPDEVSLHQRASPSKLAGVNLATVTLTLRERVRAASGSCVAVDPAGWQAYAVLAGLPADKLRGTEFLIDPNGWLRAVHRTGMPDGWDTGDSLGAAVQAILGSPIQQLNGGQHDHHH